MSLRDGLHPDLLTRLDQVLERMAAAGTAMKIVQGMRTTRQQQILYAKGRTTKGPKVTNADGIVKRSNHQVKDDGYGWAVDCAFVGPEPFAESHPWESYGAVAKECGLRWGGDWTTFVDRPHVELPPQEPQP